MQSFKILYYNNKILFSKLIKNYKSNNNKINTKNLIQRRESKVYFIR